MRLVCREGVAAENIFCFSYNASFHESKRLFYRQWSVFRNMPGTLLLSRSKSHSLCEPRATRFAQDHSTKKIQPRGTIDEGFMGRRTAYCNKAPGNLATPAPCNCRTSAKSVIENYAELATLNSGDSNKCHVRLVT